MLKKLSCVDLYATLLWILPNSYKSRFQQEKDSNSNSFFKFYLYILYIRLLHLYIQHYIHNYIKNDLNSKDIIDLFKNYWFCSGEVNCLSSLHTLLLTPLHTSSHTTLHTFLHRGVTADGWSTQMADFDATW
jgi:hypothetical protein